MPLCSISLLREKTTCVLGQKRYFGGGRLSCCKVVCFLCLFPAPVFCALFLFSLPERWACFLCSVPVLVSWALLLQPLVTTMFSFCIPCVEEDPTSPTIFLFASGLMLHSCTLTSRLRRQRWCFSKLYLFCNSSAPRAQEQKERTCQSILRAQNPQLTTHGFMPTALATLTPNWHQT